MRVVLAISLLNLASCYGISFLEIPYDVVDEGEGENFHVKLRGNAELLYYSAEEIAVLFDESFSHMVDEGFADADVLPCVQRVEVVMFDSYEDFDRFCGAGLGACQISNPEWINHSIDGWFLGIRPDHGFLVLTEWLLRHELFHAVLDCQGESNRANANHTNPGWDVLELR